MPGESEIIAMIRARSRPGPASGIEVGIGDDAAVLRSEPGADLLFCSDLSVEGIHFRTEWAGPDLIGRKALAATISDIAAMGGEPRFALASVALTRGSSMRFIEQLFAGMFNLAGALGFSLVGGDTSASPGPLFIDTCAIGHCGRGRAITRSGARQGDVVYVTGELGASAVGLSMLRQGGRLGDAGAERSDQTRTASQSAIRRHLAPEPRVQAGRLIGMESLATAMIDISDGLVTDLGHIAEDSRCGVVIDASLLPIAQSLRDLAATTLGINPIEVALTSGEEYELLFCSSPSDVHRIRDASEKLQLPITRIGEITSDLGLFIEQAGRPLTIATTGFEHEI